VIDIRAWNWSESAAAVQALRSTMPRGSQRRENEQQRRGRSLRQLVLPGQICDVAITTMEASGQGCGCGLE
jgi:hypothetical protein